MPITFYPHEDDAQKGSLTDRIAVLLDAAEHYKAVVLEVKTEAVPAEGAKEFSPHDIKYAYNWSELASMLEEVRALSEASQADKVKKATLLTRLAEVYEVLRGAKMPKLEAVRLALVNEANQLGS